MKRTLLITLALCALVATACASPLVKVTMPATVSFAGGQFQADPEATYIDFGDTRVTDWNDVVSFLHQMPALTQCDMYASPIRPKWAETLAAEFPQITFGWTLSIGSGDDLHLIRTDATAFSTLHLSGAQGHSTEELKVLRFCHELRALDIGHNNVDDISWLRELPKLRVLIIAINQITDISPLADLPELEYLEIFNNYITDITPLAGLTNLLDLNLCWNNITDYSPIYSLPKLERLWLYNSYHRYDVSPIPSAELKKLKEALPNTLMDNINEPSAGGWRSHPRFDVIYDMFRAGVYSPFEETPAEE